MFYKMHRPLTHEQWAVLTHYVPAADVYIVVPYATLQQKVFWGTRLTARRGQDALKAQYGADLTHITYSQAQYICLMMSCGLAPIAEVIDFCGVPTCKDILYAAMCHNNLAVCRHLAVLMYVLEHVAFDFEQREAIIMNSRLKYIHDSLALMALHKMWEGVKPVGIFGPMSDDEFISYLDELTHDDDLLACLTSDQVEMLEIQYIMRSAITGMGTEYLSSRRYRVEGTMTALKQRKVILDVEYAEIGAQRHMCEIQANAAELYNRKVVDDEVEDDDDAMMWAMMDE